jgi:hypothetical protein
MKLAQMLEDFVDKWGPSRPARYQQCKGELRELLEEYGKVALELGSLPELNGDPE